jgi:hypothetical protein
MTAGVPGLGLSGLFALLSALALPLTRRDAPRRRQMVAPFVLAVVISVAVVAAWQMVAALVAVAARSGHAAHGGVPILVISVAVVCEIVAYAEVVFRVFPHQPTPSPEPIPTRFRPSPAPPGRSALLESAQRLRWNLDFSEQPRAL